MGLVRLAAPATPLVTLSEAQEHLRADTAQESGLVAALVEAATAQAEAFCRRRFVTQSWRLTLDAFPAGALVLPYPPLATVQSVKYVDTVYALQTLPTADYVVRPYETPGEIVLARGKSWPAAACEPDAVQVEFTCGYGDPAAVPDAIRRAVLLVVGTLYANRETVAPVAMQEIPHTAEWLLGPFRVLRFAA
ncbi:MAG: head-tail connector protein [Planctomycetes bacterium]|nr:head-tail connector protein [Planctomycetota bacterium]